MRPDSGFWMAANWLQIGKITMTSQFSSARHHQLFLTLPCFFLSSLATGPSYWFSYWFWSYDNFRL